MLLICDLCLTQPEAINTMGKNHNCCSRDATTKPVFTFSFPTLYFEYTWKQPLSPATLAGREINKTLYYQELASRKQKVSPKGNAHWRGSLRTMLLWTLERGPHEVLPSTNMREAARKWEQHYSDFVKVCVVTPLVFLNAQVWHR